MKPIKGLTQKRCCLFCLILGVFCIALLTGSALAAEGNGPCADDIAKFCKDVKPGEGGLHKCLKEHEKELSQACKSSIDETRKKSKEGRDACKADIDRFCKDVQPGGGRIMKCLMEHDAGLSSECKAGMSKVGKK